MSGINDVISKIDREEVAQLALDLCNIDSAVGNEAAVAEFIYEWMTREELMPRKIGFLKERFSVVGTIPGTGGGASLLFNSHMDTGVPDYQDLTHIDPMDRIYHSSWRDGEHLIGEGICNDKGPMASFLIAARAFKKAGVQMKGDLVLSAVAAETAGEPLTTEPPGSYMHTREVGARYMITHGAVADYALIAEGTGFGMGWVEGGECWFRVRLISNGPPYYVPYLPERTDKLSESPNMLVASTAVIEAFEKWAREYQKKNVYKCAGGTVVPKAIIGAIRSGNPHRIYYVPQYCDLYIEVFTVPGQDPIATKNEIAQVVASTGIRYEIEQYIFRPGYEGKHVDKFVNAITRAHRDTFNDEPKPPQVETTSMWRDINLFNEVGIPAITYGPRSTSHMFKRALTVDSLYQAACVYARIAMEVCNEPKAHSLIRKY